MDTYPSEVIDEYVVVYYGDSNLADNNDLVNSVYTAAQSGSEIDKEDIDCRNGSGQTALMLSIQRKNLKIQRALIKAGADVNVKRSSYGKCTALSLAVNQGLRVTVRELLKHGAFLSCDKGIEALDMAKRFGFLNDVVEGEELLIAQNREEILDQNTGVYAAFMKNRFDLVKDLVNAGSYIALMHEFTYAPMNSSKYFLEQLIEAGIDVNRIFKEDETALIRAAYFGAPKSVEMLIRANANVNFIRKNKWTSLHIAAHGQEGIINCVRNIGHMYCVREKIVSMLIEAGADVNAETCEGETPLHFAARFRDIESIKHLVEAGASVNALDQRGDSVLHYALENPDKEKIIYLVQSGAVVNAPSKSGVLPIIRCLEIDNLELFKILIEQGADVNSTDANKTPILILLLKEKNNRRLKFSVFYSRVLYSEVNSKFQENSLETLKFILCHGANVNITDKQGETALHYCVKDEELDHLLLLLDAGADVNALDSRHDTPLITAARLYFEFFRRQLLSSDSYYIIVSSLENSIQATVLLSLISKATRVNIVDKNGNTALHYTVETFNVEIVQRLVHAGADVRKRNKKGQTVLHCAAKLGIDDIFDILLSMKNVQDIIDAKDTKLPTPLPKRRKVNSLESREISVYFLDRKSSAMATGNTALMVALENGHDDVAMKFLSNGADVNIKNDEGYTALHYAASGGCRESLRRLLQAGCKVNQQTDDGDTPLIFAKNKTITKILCEAGAEINVINVAGKKALHAAIYRRDVESVQLLIHKGTVINETSPELLPPLSLAACIGETEIVKLLIKSGAEVNGLSSLQVTPLIDAAANVQDKSSSIFHVLHENGADFNMTGKKGRTALMYLVKYGNVKVHLNSFISCGADLNIKDNERKSALVYCLLQRLDFLKVTCSEHLLKAGADPVIDEEYRHLMLKHEVKSCKKTDWIFGTEKYKSTLEIIFSKSYFNYFRMLICNGIVLKSPTQSQMFNTNETLKLTALMLALFYEQYQMIGVSKYLLAIGYLFRSDLKQLENVDQIKLIKYNPDHRLFQNVSINEDLQNVIKSAASHPWPLVKLAFITVSTMLGGSPEREERLAQTNLPPKLKQLLMFQTPIAQLPASEWSKIPLCFDPVLYETLPRPRPLLYYWPFGQDLV